MRKAQKESILEIISTLYEAHSLIKQYIDKSELDKSVSCNTLPAISASWKLQSKKELQSLKTVRLYQAPQLILHP